MPHALRRLFAAVILLAVSGAARADDKCLARGIFGGKTVALKYCEVAMYDEKGVTLAFMEDPISAEEVAAFQLNSYPREKDAGGKRRTMISLGFCPGGGKAAPGPGAVTSVEMSIEHASSPMLGRQWVFDLPKDKELKIEKLSGNLALGGKARRPHDRREEERRSRLQMGDRLRRAAAEEGGGRGPGLRVLTGTTARWSVRSLPVRPFLTSGRRRRRRAQRGSW